MWQYGVNRRYSTFRDHLLLAKFFNWHKYFFFTGNNYTIWRHNSILKSEKQHYRMLG